MRRSTDRRAMRSSGRRLSYSRSAGHPRRTSPPGGALDGGHGRAGPTSRSGRATSAAYPGSPSASRATGRRATLRPRPACAAGRSMATRSGRPRASAPGAGHPASTVNWGSRPGPSGGRPARSRSRARAVARAARRAHRSRPASGGPSVRALQLVDDEHQTLPGTATALPGRPRIGPGRTRPQRPAAAGAGRRPPAPATTCRSPTDRPRQEGGGIGAWAGGDLVATEGVGVARLVRRQTTCRGTRWRWGWRRRLGLGRVLPEDGRLERHQLRAGLDPELVGQRAAGIVQRAQGASPWRPRRHWASARMAHRAPRSGSSATDLGSATTARCSPAASRASSSSSSTVRRSPVGGPPRRPGAHLQLGEQGPRQSSPPVRSWPPPAPARPWRPGSGPAPPTARTGWCRGRRRRGRGGSPRSR